MAKAPTPRRRDGAPGGIKVDEALIALFIAAMAANGHEAPDEAARAHHLIWSTRRFRHRSGEAVGRLIDRVRRRLLRAGPDDVLDNAARSIPGDLRQPAFAVLVDLLLADGRLEQAEQRFLRKLGSRLELDPRAVRRIVDVILLKNRL